MAFMGRGGMPFPNNNQGGKQNGNTGKVPRAHYGYRLHFGPYYYIPLDNTYVIMQMIATFIIVIVGVIAYLTSYKSTVIDPIENAKTTFMNIYSITLLVLISATVIVSFFSKTKEALEKNY